jgi:hypothetical protein
MAAFNSPSIPLPSVVVVPNNETVGGTLAVTGATTLSSTLGVTGVTTVAAGSDAAPSLTFASSTGKNTGLFAPSADVTGFTVTGSEAMRLNASGYLGIGITSPTVRIEASKDGGGGDSAQLARFTDSSTSNSVGPTSLTIGMMNHFAGAPVMSIAGTTGLALCVGSGSDFSAQRKVNIDSSGNVGIGTASPTALLHVYDATNNGSAATVASRLAANYTATVGSGAAITFTDSSNNVLGQVRSITESASNIGLAFSTYNSASSEKVRINAAGNVGIGTTLPVYALQVNSDSAGKPGAGGLWTVVSDARIKTDIVDADLDRCYDIVKAVPLKHFGFKPGVYTDEQIQDKHSLGWIAQDVQAVFEKAVSVKPFTVHTPQSDGTVKDEVIEDCLDLNSGQMIAALYGCVQALMAKVEALEARG